MYDQKGLFSLFMRELITANFIATISLKTCIATHCCQRYNRRVSIPFRTWMTEGEKLIVALVLITRCQHQRPDGGDPGDCADPGLLRRLPGGGRLPHQGRGRHRARLLHSPHGGCAGGPSGAGQIPSDGRWVQATRTMKNQ